MKKEYKLSKFEIEILLLLNDKPSYGYELTNLLNNDSSRKNSFQKVYYNLNKLKDKGYLKTSYTYNNFGSQRVIYGPTNLLKELFMEPNLGALVQESRQYKLDF